MRLVSLRIARFPVPFRLTFRHASASRAKADNVIVVAESERGHRGYGEGCPRDYVTGETVASATTFFIRHHASIMAEVIDLDTLERWIAAHEAEIDADPAAFCAIELAILDLLGQDSGQPVERLLGLAPLDGTFRYSAILGDNNTAVFGAQLLRYWMAGFRDFKLKLSGDVARDRRKIALFRGHSDPSLRLRLDANNL